jgi:flagellar hook protein FlgE
MSINSALLAGVSGLAANSSALAAISDNIANVNTTAYKRNQVDFSTLVTSQVTGDYSAGGVQAKTQQFVSAQGTLAAASSNTDLAISGDGFFVVSTSSTTPASEFTRAGAFQPDANGDLVNDAGLYLMGWPVKPDGTFDTDPSDLSKLQPINIKNLGAAVQQTTSVAITANVDQTTVVGAGAATYDTTTHSMAAYANSAGASGTAPDAPPVEFSVIDSVGGVHKFSLAMEKSSTPNTWNAEVYAVPATDVSGTAGTPILSGKIVFNTDGSINTTSTTLPGTLTLGASGSAAPSWATSLGIGASSVSLDLTKLSQLAAPSTVTQVTPNGASAGNIVGVSIDTDGVVSAQFDNSQVRKIAQVAIATFPNPDGLQPLSGNAYGATLPAGGMTLKVAGTAGAGKVEEAQLESSTVDLSTEFTGLITTQKAYSASSKIITTADQMLDELINIIR